MKNNSVLDYLRAASSSNTTSKNIAIICGKERLTYAELDAMSDNIAAGLQTLGILSGECISIYMPKSIEAVVAIYATLKAGCCYVPIAPENPLPRVMYMLKNCKTKTLLTSMILDEEVINQISNAGVEVVAYNNLFAQDLFAQGKSRQANKPAVETVSEKDAAAVLHTSGSTGLPKGAVITHGNLAVFLSWAQSEFQLKSTDRLLSHAALQFDLSFFDIFASVAASATVVLATPSDTANAPLLARLINQSGVTVWQSVPSALTLQVVSNRHRPDPMPGVRCVLFAGERLSRQTLLSLPNVFPNAKYYNIYGCTETNNTFMYVLPDNITKAPDPLPIGKSLPHIKYRIVDEFGKDVKNAQPGELLVSGETIMDGYIGLSQEVLSDGFYRTKDIVSVKKDGDLDFHGRLDFVIKSNGYRVNLMEIEDHLRSFKILEEVALYSVADDLIGNRIVAVVRLRAKKACSTLDLKLYCAKALPKYAIPQSFHITYNELPKGNTGKIDKRQLKHRYGEKQSSSEKIINVVN